MQEEVVAYPASFFQRYKPNNALDMIQQLPGFQINNGGDKRGFGGAAGNILIDGRRPSTKDDAPSAILSRIPASHVARIELIRGQLENVDLRGQSVVANAVLRDDLPSTIRWEVLNSYNLDEGSSPESSVSMTDRWGRVEYNTGLLFRLTSFADSGPEKIFDADGKLIEKRFNDESTPGFEGWDVGSFLNASTALGDTLVQLNTKFFAGIRDEQIINRRFPLTPGTEPSDVVIESERRNLQFELGMDAERLLGNDLLARGIFLFNYLYQYPDDAQRLYDRENRLLEYRVAETTADNLEAIARGEFNWAGWDEHAVQFTAEAALNVLDNELIQTIDSPDSEPFLEPVPGGNVRVEELRGDLLLKDIWSLGNWVLDYSLGTEVSALSTKGDSSQTRTFTFLKPQVLLTYAPGRQEQTRLRLAKEVSQLDLNDFVSATVFLDDDLALGNPNLKPESSWVTEISHERRFGELGVVTLTGFHHWINDVEDLLPVTPESDAPGNIGDGLRWNKSGIEVAPENIYDPDDKSYANYISIGGSGPMMARIVRDPDSAPPTARVILGTTHHTARWRIMTGTDITSVKQLKGKRLGYSGVGAVSHNYWLNFLEQMGWDPHTDVTLVGDALGVSALMDGTIDALMAPELHGTMALMNDFTELADMAEYGFAVAGSALQADRQWYEKNPEAARAFIKTAVDAIALMKTNKAAAEETMIKWYGMDDQLARDLFYTELLKMDSKPYPPYEGAEMILRHYGGWDARAKFRPEDFYDDTIIKELDESGYIDSLYPGGKSPR